MHVGLFDVGKIASLQQAADRLVSVFAHRMELSNLSRVLDIGCGTCGPAVQIANTYGCQVVGVTISRSQAARAAQRIVGVNRPQRVFVLLANAEERIFPSASFTSAMAIESLCHMNRAIVFHEVYRVLVPSGGFTFCDWYVKSALSRVEVELLERAVQMRVITLDNYRELCLTTGFRQVCVTDWSSDVLPTYAFWRRDEGKQSGLPPTYLEEAARDNNALLDLLSTKLGYACINCTKPL